MINLFLTHLKILISMYPFLQSLDRSNRQICVNRLVIDKYCKYVSINGIEVVYEILVKDVDTNSSNDSRKLRSNNTKIIPSLIIAKANLNRNNPFYSKFRKER